MFKKPRLMTQPLPLGKTGIVLTKTATEAGEESVAFDIDSEAILISLFVTSVSGNLTVTVKTITNDNQTFTVTTFPVISAPTSELVIKKAATVMGRVLVEATYTDACEFEIRAKGVNSAEASVRIAGAADATASQLTIGTTPTIIIPSALSDRSGVVVKNNNTGGERLYLGFTAAQASTSIGYPIGPQEALALDVDSGVELYGVADSGTIDIRILEAGG